METEKVKHSHEAIVSVTATNFQNGNVMESTGKLKTVFGGKNAITEESLTFRGSDCGKSTIEANYNASTTGESENKSEVELDIKGRILNDKKELIDVIATSAKLSKADAGCAADVKSEDFLSLKIENSCDAKCANTESYYTHRDSASGLASGK